MAEYQVKRWRVHSSALPGNPLIGEIFCARLPASGNEQEEAPAEPAVRRERMNSLKRAALPENLLLPRFRYSQEWLECGFALGADLPLTAGIHLPLPGMRTFGFLADRALDESSAVWFEEASSLGSKGTQNAPGASRAEALGILLPHRTAHAGAIDILSESGEPAGSALPVPQESKGIEGILYALHAAERSRSSLKTLLELTASAALPGRHSSMVLLSGRSEQALTLRRMNDVLDAPLWRQVYLELARASGIETQDSRLISTMGSRALLTERADRAGGSPVFTLSGAALMTPRTASYLGLAEILNSGGASPGEDLPKIWKRMAFAFLTGASDAPRKWLFIKEDFGWRLAPAHGWLPSAGMARPMPARGRKMLASAEDAVQLAPYFGMRIHDAKRELIALRRAISDWEDLALSLGAAPEETDELAPGFNEY